MPSDSAATTETDRWVGSVDDVGLFAVVFGFALVVAAPAFDYLLFGPGAEETGGPTTALALLVALGVGAVLAVSGAGDRLETLLDPPADETAWHEVRRFGFAVLGTTVLLSLPGSILVDWGGVPTSLAIAAHHLVVVGLSLAALALRRLWQPGSLGAKIHALGFVHEVNVVSPRETDEGTNESGTTDEATTESGAWDRWDSVSLFAGAFLLAWFGLSSDYEFFVVGGAGLGVGFGSVAVALRYAGALVPDEDSPESTTTDAADTVDDREATGTD